VEYGDSDIEDVTISLGDHNTSIIPDPAAFEDAIRGLFILDASAHSLKVKPGAGGSDPDGIPLYQFVLPPNTDSETIRFDYNGLVGVTAVPESSTWAMLASLTAVSGWVVARRKGVITRTE